MDRKKRVLFGFVFILMLVALPTSALANKRVFKARLAAGNEVPAVTNSSASGSALLATDPGDGMYIRVSVRGLSGAPTAAHLHGPADANNNASPVVWLCGPANSVYGGPCPYDGAGGMTLEGWVRGGDVVGMTQGAFFSALESGLIYINVHTALNPAGETRGQFYEQ